MVRDEQTQRLKQNDALIKLAEAELNLAKLNLSYTVILATADGMTGRKNIHDGQMVQVGQTMVTLIDNTKKWIIANYKEMYGWICILSVIFLVLILAERFLNKRIVGSLPRIRRIKYVMKHN